MYFVVEYENGVTLTGFSPRNDIGLDLLDKLKTWSDFTIHVFGNFEDYTEFLRSEIAEGV